MSYLVISVMVFTAFGMTVLFIPWAIKLAQKMNVVDMPGDRRIHSTAIPLFGGVAFSISFVLTTFIFLEFSSTLTGFMAGLMIIFITGIADDIWHLRPIVKFSGEIIAAIVFIYLTGYTIQTFGDLVGTGPLGTGQYAILITVFCMVGVMNATNMIDGMDGLAGGVSLIGCLWLAYFAALSNYVDLLALILILAGALLGFLFFNKHPAKVFMGDTGSLMLGYVLSAICILLVQDYDDKIRILPVSMAITLGLPIVDALLVMTLRIVNGHNPFHPDNTHLHHRLLSLGLEHKVVVIVMYILMLLCGLLAMTVSGLPEWIQFYIGVAVAIIIFGSIYLLQYRHKKIKLQKTRLI